MRAGNCKDQNDPEFKTNADDCQCNKECDGCYKPGSTSAEDCCDTEPWCWCSPARQSAGNGINPPCSIIAPHQDCIDNNSGAGSISCFRDGCVCDTSTITETDPDTPTDTDTDTETPETKTETTTDSDTVTNTETQTETLSGTITETATCKCVIFDPCDPSVASSKGCIIGQFAPSGYYSFGGECGQLSTSTGCDGTTLGVDLTKAYSNCEDPQCPYGSTPTETATDTTPVTDTETQTASQTDTETATCKCVIFDPCDPSVANSKGCIIGQFAPSGYYSFGGECGQLSTSTGCDGTTLGVDLTKGYANCEDPQCPYGSTPTETATDTTPATDTETQTASQTDTETATCKCVIFDPCDPSVANSKGCIIGQFAPSGYYSFGGECGQLSTSTGCDGTTLGVDLTKAYSNCEDPQCPYGSTPTETATDTTPVTDTETQTASQTDTETATCKCVIFDPCDPSVANSKGCIIGQFAPSGYYSFGGECGQLSTSTGCDGTTLGVDLTKGYANCEDPQCPYGSTPTETATDTTPATDTETQTASQTDTETATCKCVIFDPCDPSVANSKGCIIGQFAPSGYYSFGGECGQLSTSTGCDGTTLGVDLTKGYANCEDPQCPYGSTPTETATDTTPATDTETQTASQTDTETATCKCVIFDPCDPSVANSKGCIIGQFAPSGYYSFGGECGQLSTSTGCDGTTLGVDLTKGYANCEDPQCPYGSTPTETATDTTPVTDTETQTASQTDTETATCKCVIFDPCDPSVANSKGCIIGQFAPSGYYSFGGECGQLSTSTGCDGTTLGVDLTKGYANCEDPQCPYGSTPTETATDTTPVTDTETQTASQTDTETATCKCVIFDPCDPSVANSKGCIIGQFAPSGYYSFGGECGQLSTSTGCDGTTLGVDLTKGYANCEDPQCPYGSTPTETATDTTPVTDTETQTASQTDTETATCKCVIFDPCDPSVANSKGCIIGQFAPSGYYSFGGECGQLSTSTGCDGTTLGVDLTKGYANCEDPQCPYGSTPTETATDTTPVTDTETQTASQTDTETATCKCVIFDPCDPSVANSKGCIIGQFAPSGYYSFGGECGQLSTSTGCDGTTLGIDLTKGYGNCEDPECPSGSTPTETATESQTATATESQTATLTDTSTNTLTDTVTDTESYTTTTTESQTVTLTDTVTNTTTDTDCDDVRVIL